MQLIANSWGLVRRIGRMAGPYLMMEVLLPGGTLFALVLYLYRSRKLDIGI